MLTWFKRVLNRFVKSDVEYENDTEADYEYEYEQVTDTEQEEHENDSKPKHPPSFRFPIITDAEIYGWDEEGDDGRSNLSTPPLEMLEDDFEPVPLYKNERWPGRNESVTIHRTETERRLDKNNFRMTGATLEAPSEAKIEKKQPSKPTRNRPFTPTEVPSPVYGFRKPEKTVLNEEQLPPPKSQSGLTEVHNWADSKAPSRNDSELPALGIEDAPVPVESIERDGLGKVLQSQEEEPTKQELRLEAIESVQAEQKLLDELPERPLCEETAEADSEHSVEEMAMDVQEEPQPVREMPEEPVDTYEAAPEFSLETKTMDVQEEFEPVNELLEKTGFEDKAEADMESLPEWKAMDDQQDLEPVHDLSDRIAYEDLAHDASEFSQETVIMDGQEELANKIREESEDEDTSMSVSELSEQQEALNVQDETTPVNEMPERLEFEDTLENAPQFSQQEEARIVQSATEPAEELPEDGTVHVGKEETAIEQPQEREKVVPFNVLMLKSDKMKIDRSAERIVQQPQTVASTTETVDETVEQSFEEEEPYYAFPSLELLVQPEEHIEDVEWLETQSVKLEEALSYFSIQANVIEAVQGPTVTRFELTVGHGTKVSKIRNLTDDLKLALAAEDIRIQAPIPGTSSIGIEIPNRRTRAVRISEVIQSERFRQSMSPLEAVLGLSLTGEPVTLDLRKMPHGMIAGATGSGKSVCINSILTSLLYKAAPTDVKLLLIDPKMVELAPYNGVPHLLSPVITDVKAATAALKWAVDEMERRYELFAHAGARNIERYNEMVTASRQFSLKMPYLLIVIDELADLMMTAPADVEVSISRITQKARACGIHLIIATQRPSVDVITGTIKANVPTRIAFSVSSQVDSRTIIDSPGAERLLGKGDMLYLGNGQSSSIRLQGTFVTDEEIERIIEHVQNEAKPNYLFGQEDLLANSIEEEETDPLFEEACKFIIEHGSASTSLLQRNFGIGYNRAAKLMDKMEKLSFISEQKGSKPRDVYLTQQDFEQYLNRFEQN